MKIRLLPWFALAGMAMAVSICPTLLQAAPSDPDDAAVSTAANDMDRPGEVENPFSLPSGRVQLVNYLLAANSQAREANELGLGGGAVMLQSGARFGLGGKWEGQIFANTFLNAIYKGPAGDDPGRPAAGVGFATLRAKSELVSSTDGESGLALVFDLRVPTSHILAVSSATVPGLILAYSVDLEHGFELQGSTGVAWNHGENGGRSAEFETQLSLEWHASPRWQLYVEPQLQVGQGRPGWETEYGASWIINRSWRLDLGDNHGVGHASSSHFAYCGAAVSF